MQWETVIGLEVHVQLATASKIFSGSSTAFGAEPNTQANAVDLGLPGVLPVLNEGAVKKAIAFGLAIDAEIGKRSFFERKNYFYPDLPKGYQTTQLEAPIVGRGHVDIMLDDGSSKRVRIHHAHLEEDAGKSLHEDFHGMTGIDLNRAGTPLIEIVTEPDMRSSAEAVAFAKKLHTIVTALGICDGEMSQGSMRFDVNVSIRPKGSDTLGTRTETKNLNSFKFMEEAIKLEVERQIDVLEDGDQVIQQTRLYNGDTKVARAMRSKEEANDYRYFPCPDLLPVVIDDDYINAIRATLPELPDAKIQRFQADYQLAEYDASVLAANGALADYFEAVVSVCNDAKLAANWCMGELSKLLNQGKLEISDCPIKPATLGLLLARIKDDTVSGKAAKTVFQALADGAEDVDGIIAEKGLKQVTDSGAIEAIVDQVIAANPGQFAELKDGKDKLIGFFVGQVMKASKGQANPGQVNAIIKKKLAE